MYVYFKAKTEGNEMDFRNLDGVLPVSHEHPLQIGKHLDIQYFIGKVGGKSPRRPEQFRLMRGK